MSVRGMAGPKEEKAKLSEHVLPTQPQILDYDKILEHIGGFGVFQQRIFVLVWIASMYCAMAVMSFSFTGAVLEHRCALPECGDDAVESGFWSKSVNSSSYPPSSDWRCNRYENVSISDGFCSASEGNKKETKCSDWIYDDSVVTQSIISEFNLVCDQSWIEPVLGSAYMFGMLFGSFCFGSLADKIGRQKSYFLVAAIASTVQCLAAFSVDPIMFFIMRLLAGATAVGLFQILSILGSEFVGSEYRLTCGFIMNIFFSIGSCIVGLVVLGVKEWRVLQLIYGAPGFLILLYWWVLPESPQWLIAKGRYEEAKKIILKAAETNKRTIPEELLYIPSELRIPTKSSVSSSRSGSTATDKSLVENEGTMIDVLKNEILRKRALSMFFVWFVVSLAYYGLSMVVTALSSDYILNYELVMIVEIPSYVAGILLVNTLGRKTMLTICMMFGGVACILAGVVPSDPTWLASLFSLVGKFFVSGAYALIYSYTVELFPTAVRSAALGSSSMSARIGSILAPFIASTSSIDKMIPFTIFGVFALLSGFAIVMLPETKGKPLPQTFQDALDLETGRSSLSCCKSTETP